MKAAAEHKAIDWNAMGPQQFANSIFAEVKGAGPSISEVQLKEIDQWASRDREGSTRRAALMVLTRPGSWLIDTVERDREAAVAFADVRRAVDGYVDGLKELTRLLESSSARIMVALCGREDAESVIAEAANPEGELAGESKQ